MKHLTAQMVADAINRVSSQQFDAHDVEKSALRLHPVETAKEILEKAGSPDALQYFSADFARYVDRTFAGQIRRTARVETENLGGRKNFNQQWEKLVPTVTAPADGRDVGQDDAEILEDEERLEAIHAVALRNAAGRLDDEP